MSVYECYKFLRYIYMGKYKYVCVRMVMFMSMCTWRSYFRNFKLKSETQGWRLSSRLVTLMLCYDRFRDGGLIPPEV